jgi:hypothetical protein
MSTIIKLMEVVTETIIIIAWCQMVKSQNFIYALLIWRRKALKKFSYFRNLIIPFPFFETCCFYPPPLSLSLPLPYLFHPFYLSSVFIQYFSPFLSFRYIESTYARLSLSRHSTFCTFCPLLPSNTCFLSHRSHM